MKRKLFSAILFGALLTASTSGLTSCKDYDDDISNLQSQIDKLATADQLSAKVSEMQAAISAAQSAAEAKAAAAQTVADAAKAAAADAAAAASKAQGAADDAAKAAAAAAEVGKAAQAAVDKLAAEAATKAELEAAKEAAAAAVKAIEEAHAADKAAIEKAIADGLDAVKADIAKTNEELAKLAARLDAVDKKLAALEAGEGQEEALKEIQAEVEAISDVLKSIIGEYTSMVTAVDLYVGGGVPGLVGALELNTLRFVYVDQEKDTKFPAAEGVADEQIEFSSKNKNVMTTDKLLVRVSPTNAVLNAANISLLNSQGADLSDYVEVKAVKPYEELIIDHDYDFMTRAAEGNGLWEVEFKVKDGVDAAKFADAVSVKEGLTTYSIKYAVAVQNTESDETRRVVSAYDVKVLPEDYEPASNEIEVTNRDDAWTSISEIRNRYHFNGKNKPGNIVAENNTVTGEASELAWVNKPDVAGGSEPTVQDASDSRNMNNGYSLIDVEIGKSIDIVVGNYWNPVNRTSDVVKGFYVTLDSENAIESAPSEINAWESYSYTNVGVPGDSKRPAKMFYGNEGSISIDSPAALGDIIGFRVYVVNLDGTLVDPDGRAFYVNVAKEKVVAKLTAEEMVAELNYDKDNDGLSFGNYVSKSNSNYYVIAELTKEAAAAIKSAHHMDQWTITENASNYGNNSIEVEDGDFTIEFNEKADFSGSDEWSKAKYVKLVINTPTNFLDEGTYAAQNTLYNSNGTEICDLSVTFKKTLPEYAPVLGWAPAYNPSTQVFANKAQNDPTIYQLEATTSTPAAVEMTDLMKSLEYGSWTADKSYYTLEFAKATADGKSIKLPTSNSVPATTTVGTNNEYKLTPDVKAIDGKSHDVTYGYDYGYISLTKNYQTAQYTRKHHVADCKENLAMTFASWIHYEQIALAAAKSFTYRPGQAGNTVGTIILVGEAGSAGSEALAWSVSSDVVADLASASKTYYKKVADGYYRYNPLTGLYVKPNGNDFFEATEDVDRIKTYAEKLVMGADKYYVKEVSGTGTTAVEYIVEVTNAKFYKKISNGDYYLVAYVAADNAWKFCKADGTTVYNNQTEDNVKDQNKSGNVTILADGTGVNAVYVWTTTTVGGSAGTKSDLVAWNTVIRNYGADGKPIFGSEAVKKNFGELVGTYLTVKSAKTGDNDPFTATVSADGKTVTLTQKTGTLNPGNEGTLTIVIVDCFGIEQSRTVKYSIAQ